MKGLNERRATTMALVAVGLWSTVAVAFKKALEGLSPIDLVILASFVSWLVLGAVLLVRRFGSGRIDIRTADPESSETASVLPDALLGLLNPVLYYLVLFAAYDRLPAQAAQPLNYTWPLVLALLAAPLNRRYPSLRELAAIGISLVGVVLISRQPLGAGEPLDGVGVALALGSGVLWALYWLLGQKRPGDGPVRLFRGFSLAVPVLAVFWWSRGFPLPASLSSALALVWVGLFEMGITFLFWNRALESTARPARIGNLVYLGPFISLLWIRIFLGEHIRSGTVAGLLVIVLGILFSQDILFPCRSQPDDGFST